MAGDTTQSGTLASLPSGLPVGADVVGTARAPVAGDRIQYVKLDVGAAGASSPVVGAVPVSAASLPLPAGAAQDGTDITAPTAMPAGGVGIRGWLSAIWTKLNGTIGVTGTFWQATQPVSIAATVPVSLATAPSTPVTNAGTFAVQAAATLAAETTKVIGTVNPPAITKGTQGATGFTTQDLKDSGRVAITFTAEFSPAAVAETMVTLSVSKDGAAPSTGSSYVITSGKRLRIASKSIAVENTLGTSIQRVYLRTRFAATGGALVTSPLQANCVASAAGTVKSVGSNFDDYPDGLEFLGDGTKAIGWSVQAPDWVSATSTLKVYITIICFEY